MKKIVAIGGGVFGSEEMMTIDREIVRMTNKPSPRVLFVPTASNDSEEACMLFEKVYGEKLKCKVEYLFLLKEEPDYNTIAQKINKADLIYVGNGNALMMLRKWRFRKVSGLLQKASKRGTVLAGIGAGATCWFEYGHSDSMSYYNVDEKKSNWDFIRVKCLGIVDRLTLCPHFNEDNRQASFKNMMHKIGGVGLGIEDNCALQIIDNQYKILPIQNNTTLHRVFKIRAKTIQKSLPINTSWQNLSLLRRKF